MHGDSVEAGPVLHLRPIQQLRRFGTISDDPVALTARGMLRSQRSVEPTQEIGK